MPDMCPFEKKEKEVFFRLPTFFSGTKKKFPRNNFCSVFHVLESKKENCVLKIFDFQKSLGKLGPTVEDFNSS